jgi:DNA primase
MSHAKIHPDTIEEVKIRADIVTIISDHVVLHERGKDLVGKCPFCKEQTPLNTLPAYRENWNKNKTSFTVSPTKNMYYCFNCQIGGNSIKFLMDIQGRTSSNVVIELAKRCQIPVTYLQ